MKTKTNLPGRLRRLFPSLTGAELDEAAEDLRRYAALVARMYGRLRGEARSGDGPLTDGPS
jgi:hypothetical protein